MMTTAEQGEVGQPRLAAICPVMKMVGVTVARRAAWKLAMAIASRERPADRWRDGAPLPSHIEHRAVWRMPHHHRRRVAGDAARRFR
jgi:hypothetical protein